MSAAAARQQLSVIDCALRMHMPLHASAVTARSILSVGLLLFGCRTSPTDNAPAEPIPSSLQPAASASVASELATCRTDEACGEGQKCILVDGPGPGRRCAIAQPGHLVDAIGIPRWGANVPNIRAEFVARLIVLQGARLDAAPACQLKLCPKRDGKPAACCNTCRDLVVLRGSFGSDASEHPAGIPVVDSLGLPLSCGTRMDCEKASCPAGWGMGRKRELVGTFEKWGKSLRFRLARSIEPLPPLPSAAASAK